MRPSSLSSLLLVFLAATSSAALPHPPLTKHKPRNVEPPLIEPRELFGNHSTSFKSMVSKTGRHSPRPTPQGVVGGLARAKNNYKLRKQKKAKALLESAMQPLKRATCLDSTATADDINDALNEGGVGATVLLCAGAKISLTEGIFFTDASQTLQTQGGSAIALTSRATLTITGSTLSTAIDGTGCINCDNLTIDSLIIDGGRTALGAIDDGGPLIDMGGTSQTHTVNNCQIANTRGWSSLHIIEGTGLVCSGAVITNNVIGPSGESYDVGNIADGISLSCRNSKVQNNEIFDATDGGIVVFAAPGSDISGNTITSKTLVMLGGINMVDAAPFNGDYSGTIVQGNTLLASGAQMKIGIAQGGAIWGDSTDTICSGAKVTANTFGGTHMSFGLAVAGTSTWGISNNFAQSTARFQGQQSDTCHDLGGTVTPTFAIQDPSKNTGLTIWNDANCWTQGALQYLICYEASTAAGVAPASAFLSGGSCSASAPISYTSSSWKDSGYCVTDSTTRILDGYFVNEALNTPELCTTTCTSLQYAYAGLENGKQCYCGNSIETSSGQGAVIDSTLCSAACPGDASTICGGNSYTMSLWYDALRVDKPVL